MQKIGMMMEDYLRQGDGKVKVPETDMNLDGERTENWLMWTQLGSKEKPSMR